MLQLLVYQMLHVLLPSQNNRNYSEHVLRTHSPLKISTSTGTPICSFVCICYPWFEWLRQLYFMYYAWAGFSGGKEQEDKLYACYCSRAIHHVTWYVCTLLVCNLQVSREISLATLLCCTLMHLSSLNWAGVLWWMRTKITYSWTCGDMPWWSLWKIASLRGEYFKFLMSDQVH